MTVDGSPEFSTTTTIMTSYNKLIPLFRFLNIFLFIEILYCTKDSLIDPKKYVKVYSSCDPTPDSTIHQNNGLYYIKPTDDGPVIPVICSNGYTMIDVSLDTNLKSIPSYLSSWDYSRTSLNYIITNLDDTSTFREWWLPSDRNTKFRVANDCTFCEQSTDALLEDNAVYYTDSFLFAYTSYTGDDACADKINDYACNVCNVGKFPDRSITNHWSQCSALQTSADTPSWHDPQMRVNHHLIYRPVMSLTRGACTCYQPQLKDGILKEHRVLIDELPPVTIGGNRIGVQQVTDTVEYIDDIVKLEDIHVCDPVKEDCVYDEKEETKCEENKVYLTQSDFEYGTYRIRECGEYIFSEDIVCNFNAPSKEEQLADDFSPNRIDTDELYWYPTREQSDKDNEYPGLYKYVGSYSLGFFAGITIEAKNVIINLNGYTFKMDDTFYLQQRFFSLIEMASKMFQPLQGPSTWGLTNVFYASNVEIKGPGTLGRTSHHGIHGNKANNIYIHDIDIGHFDVAGFACNGCEYIRIEDVSVGPQNNDIPTLGRYTHARAFLPRLKHLNDKSGEQTVTFYGREETSVSQLCQRMVHQMDMIYHNVINHRQYADDDEEWIAAKKIFKNPTGWMDGGSSYGIVINGGGAAVVGIGTRIQSTSNIHMKNIEIFGIYNKAIEKIKFGLDTGTTRGILFEAIDWMDTTDQLEDRSKSQYIGDCYTDIQFVSARFIDSWYFRNSYFVGQQEVDYVFKGNTEETEYPFLTILPEREDFYGDPITRSCGTDIQLHSSKGAIGMMINGALESSFDNIHIHDIYNWADLGTYICGPYDRIHVTFEDIDIQYGYTGNNAHGLVIDFVDGDYTNIDIENIESYHGSAHGMSIYKGAFVNLMNIKVNNIQAGTQLNDADVATLTLPNPVPRACGVDVHDHTDIQYLKGDDRDNLEFDNIHGFVVCDPFVSDDERNTDSYQILNPRIVFGVLVCVVSVAFVVMVCMMYEQFCCLGKSKSKKISEHTPLLTKDNQIV